MAPEVVMYSMAFCIYCTQAKRLLAAKQVPYRELRIDQSADLRKEMESKSGRITAPQIFIGQQHIGGFDDLAALERQGLLDEILMDKKHASGMS